MRADDKNSKEKSQSKDDSHQEIPGMQLEKYSNQKPIIPEGTEKIQEEMNKTKKELERLKGFILKKYPFTQTLSILPPQAMKFFIEEEEIPKETEKYIQLLWIIPEDQFKNIPKIKTEVIKEIEKTQEKLKQKIWLQIKTPVDIWETCFDSKFEMVSAISMSMPLYDQGLLAALRVAEIHKSMVLQKFDKYVVSYVLGGSLVRGDAVKTSDVDAFIIINDTDVKRMQRIELIERLRGIIYEYIPKATALAGVKQNMLNVQVYILTDFWQSVKDANPIIFTFIRDGVPLYDRHTFMPWKALLKMGKLKPSPEAIDMFMSMGDNTVKRAKRALLDILLGDIYWSVITPSQALLMLYGLPPPTTKETFKEMKRIFVDKEKILEPKYIKILEEITIKYYKGYEHEKIKEVSGKEIDKLLKDTEDYIKRLKELRVQIEKKAQQRTIDQVYDDLFNLLKTIIGNRSQELIVQDFEKDFVKKGHFTQQHLRILKDVLNAKLESKKGKLTLHKADEARKNAIVLVNSLIEYSQRKELIAFDKGRMRIKHEHKIYELLNVDGKTFLFIDKDIKKVTDKLEEANMNEVNEAIDKQKEKKSFEINPRVFEVLKKELGDFEIIL
ncbi:MAG TPA: nucleotidyltransferase domain-containing protein [Candidatus Nanoarchaeia archaeon]|nr:nucleotidyltransferase domain-containing protein [Candidatus Nanoarchaeia archaeon]